MVGALFEPDWPRRSVARTRRARCRGGGRLTRCSMSGIGSSSSAPTSRRDCSGSRDDREPSIALEQFAGPMFRREQYERHPARDPIRDRNGTPRRSMSMASGQARDLLDLHPWRPGRRGSRARCGSPSSTLVSRWSPKTLIARSLLTPAMFRCAHLDRLRELVRIAGGCERRRSISSATSVFGLCGSGHCRQGRHDVGVAGADRHRVVRDLGGSSREHVRTSGIPRIAASTACCIARPDRR